jgi:hypothetical protein
MNCLDISVGDRVKLLRMPDDPDPIPVGSVGTVRLITDLHFREAQQVQFLIAWDNGRSLSCICPPDELEIVTDEYQIAEEAGIYYVTRGGKPVMLPKSDGTEFRAEFINQEAAEAYVRMIACVIKENALREELD